MSAICDVAAAESALAAPYAGYGDVDLYPDAATKAAILCSRLIRNHPLLDGNKRCAYVSMRYFLDVNGLRWDPPSEDERVETIERLAAGELAEEDFVAWVRARVS